MIKKTAPRSGPRIYGYARVSTLDQDLTIQHAALEAAGCMTIFEEKKSGTRRDGRTELQVLLECVREGDTVIVTRIDRLARSMKDLQDIVHELKEKGVSLKATQQPIDTRSAAGKAFLDMLGVFAEFEANLRREASLRVLMVDRRYRSEFAPFYFDLVINDEANRSNYGDATCILGDFLTVRAAAPGSAGRKAVVADW
jgi:DNA invertase Pin-like site-specific DNA recombinase